MKQGEILVKIYPKDVIKAFFMSEFELPIYFKANESYCKF